MRKSKSTLTAAVILGGAIGFTGTPAWSQAGSSGRQSAPSDHDRTPTTPGREQQLPPRATETPRGAEGMSSQDIKQVQQALQAKGHNAGDSGVLDDKTRDAIRAFQKEQGLTMTGTVDAKTAQALGVSMGQSPSGGSSTGGSSRGSGSGSATGSGSSKVPGSSGSGGGSSER